MAFTRITVAIVGLLSLLTVLGSQTATHAQAGTAGGGHEPILIPGVREPDEMRVEPLPVTNYAPTEPQRMLADAINNAGNIKSAAMLLALNQILTKYPDFADGYVMRLATRCEGTDLAAIASDIDNALKYRTDASASSNALASLLSMKAKIEYSGRHESAAIEDLDKAIHADLEKAVEFSNSAAVAPERTALVCIWTEPDLDALIQHFPADYRTYIFRGLYHGFFLFFEKDEKTRQIALGRVFDDLNAAAKLNPSSALPRLFKAEIFQRTYLFQMMSIYDPRHDELNKTMLGLLDDALSPDSNNVWASRERALIQTHLANWRQAIADYDKALALDPNDFVSRNDRALAKLQIGDVYDAISDLNEVIKNKPRELNNSSSYEARADAYMKIGQWNPAIRDLTTAISMHVGSQVQLANVGQFRALYPEYAPATDQAIARKLQQTFFSNRNYEGFADSFLHKNGSFGFPDFVIADLFLKRSDAYLWKGNWHAAKLDFKRAQRGYPDAPDSVDRWRKISPGTNANAYLDLRTFNDDRRQAVNLWIKQVRGDDGPYSVDQYEVNCGSRQLRLLSSTRYDASGSLVNSRKGGGWTTIVPDTLGESLHNGICESN